MEKSRLIASRLVGKARKAVAALRGETGVFASLEEDHGELLSLMRQVSKTSDTRSGVERRSDLFDAFRQDLLVHMRAEEAVFYSVLKQHDETRRRTLHSLEEHQELETLLRQLDVIDPHELGWMAIFERLRQLFERHVHEEEQKLFPQAHRLLRPEQILAMENDLGVERERQLREIRAGRADPAQRTPPPPS